MSPFLFPPFLPPPFLPPYPHLSTFGNGEIYNSLPHAIACGHCSEGLTVLTNYYIFTVLLVTHVLRCSFHSRDTDQTFQRCSVSAKTRGIVQNGQHTSPFYKLRNILLSHLKNLSSLAKKSPLGVSKFILFHMPVPPGSLGMSLPEGWLRSPSILGRMEPPGIVRTPGSTQEALSHHKVITISQYRRSWGRGKMFTFNWLKGWDTVSWTNSWPVINGLIQSIKFSGT